MGKDPQRISVLFEAFRKSTVLVLGDMMLDQYFWGRVARISPEAPVPVVEIDSESYRFGGAANVAHNVTALGATCLPVGVIGRDNSGRILGRLFEAKGIPADGLVVDPDRPTTVKTRIIAHGQHVVRTDREVRTDVSRSVQQRILDFVASRLAGVKGIVLEDYNKGLLVPKIIEPVIAMANRAHVPVFVDPKFDHFFNYRRVTVFKPNRKETADVLGMRLDSEEEIEKAGRRILEKLECRALLVTLGESGMLLMEPGKPARRIPTRAKKVHDVSGAGDTVIATLAVAMTAGAKLDRAAAIANTAAGIVCGEVGVVPIDRDRLLQVLLEDGGDG